MLIIPLTVIYLFVCLFNLSLDVHIGKAFSSPNRMSKSEPEEMIEIEIDEREKQACLEEG